VSESLIRFPFSLTGFPLLRKLSLLFNVFTGEALWPFDELITAVDGDPNRLLYQPIRGLVSASPTGDKPVLSTFATCWSMPRKGKGCSGGRR
jgi:hypothetical protein